MVRDTADSTIKRKRVVSEDCMKKIDATIMDKKASTVRFILMFSLLVPDFKKN